MSFFLRLLLTTLNLYNRFFLSLYRYIDKLLYKLIILFLRTASTKFFAIVNRLLEFTVRPTRITLVVKNSTN